MKLKNGSGSDEDKGSAETVTDGMGKDKDSADVNEWQGGQG